MDNNTLIAMYMGDEYIKGSDSWIYPTEGNTNTLYRSSRSWRTSELRYGNDWNWLIPATKKVRWELLEEIEKDPYAIHGYPYEKELRVTENKLQACIKRLNIEEVWKATVETIQLINKVKDADNREDNSTDG